MSRESVKKRDRSESGEALVEFALVLPILLVLSLGMLDFGRAFHVKGLLDMAAREGCRVAVVTNPPDNPIVQDRVGDILGAANVAWTRPAAVSGPDPSRMVTVTVKATFTFVTPGVFRLIGAGYGNTIEMTGESTMRYEAGTTQGGGSGSSN